MRRPTRLKQAVELARQARAEDETWTPLYYLWPQHPIVEWLVDRVITLFGRQRAPIIQSHYLQPGEQAFVMLGLVLNRTGQPLLVDWQVACRQLRQPFRLESWEAFLPRAGLQAGQLPNSGLTASFAGLAGRVAGGGGPHAPAPGAPAARLCRDEMQRRLQGTLADLERRLEKQLEQVRWGPVRAS